MTKEFLYQGFIQANAPPFIVLTIAFTTLPLVFIVLSSTYSTIAESRFRSFLFTLSTLSCLPSLSLGVLTLWRIYLNGKYNLFIPTSTQNWPLKTFGTLDQVIIFNLSLCLSCAIALLLLWTIAVRWYPRYTDKKPCC